MVRQAVGKRKKKGSNLERKRKGRSLSVQSVIIYTRQGKKNQQTITTVATDAEEERGGGEEHALLPLTGEDENEENNNKKQGRGRNKENKKEREREDLKGSSTNVLGVEETNDQKNRITLDTRELLPNVKNEKE